MKATPNQPQPVDAPIVSLFHIGHHGRRATDACRWQRDTP
jgi:hypothetical protein